MARARDSDGSPADYWLSGVIVLAMVVGALVGGFLCTYLIASSHEFQVAAKKSPLFLGWLTLVAAEGAISWAGLWPAIATCWSGWRSVSRRNIKWLFLTLVAIVIAIVMSLWLEPQFLPHAVRASLVTEHGRVAIMTLIVLIPPLVAVFGMWFAAVHANEIAHRFDGIAPTRQLRRPRKPLAGKTAHEAVTYGAIVKRDEPGSTEPCTDVAKYLELRDSLQSLLWYVGIVVGGGVLATGALRTAMIDSGSITEREYPEPLVLAYGAFFTLLLVVSYVPAHLLMRHAGNRLMARSVKAKDVFEWHEQRTKLAALLNLDLGLGDSLKNTIAVLAPLVAGFASAALPK